jgi:kynurenine formamidase
MENKSVIDLSHTIEDGLVTYKGLPAPVICDYWSREHSRQFYAEGVEFQIGKIEMVANTGTYIDVPFHRYADGKDLSEIPAAQFVDLEGVVVRVSHKKTLAISANYFRDVDVRNRAVLIHTGWAEYWNTPAYYQDHPFLTKDAAEYLRDNGALLLGIDSHNIDDVADKTRPAHSILLRASIFIVEHLCNLESIPPKNFLFSALPPKFKGVGTFPVRAIAKVP